MQEKPEKFKKCIQKCLRYHILAINKLVDDGMIFWEYGNGLQYEASQAGIFSPPFVQFSFNLLLDMHFLIIFLFCNLLWKNTSFCLFIS